MTKEKRKLKPEDFSYLFYDEARNNFFFKIENSKLKPLDLSKSSFKIFEDLYNRILTNKICSLSDFQAVLLKSYLNNGKKEVLNQLADKYGLNSSLPSEIIPIFLNDYFDKDYEINVNVEQREKILNDMFIKNLEDVFGNCINITEIKNLDPEKLRFLKTSNLRKKLIEDGYEIYEDFAISKREIKNQPNLEHQNFILSKYSDVVNKYFENKKFGSRKSLEEFKNLNKIVDFFLENCESLMTEETKARTEFINAKKVVDSYNKEIRRKIEDRHFSETLQSDFYIRIYGLLKRKDDNFTDEEKKELKEFVKDIEKIYKAMSYKDKKGQKHPANYYLQDISKNTTPSYMVKLILDASKSKFFNEDEKKIFIKAKNEIRLFITKYIEDTFSSFLKTIRTPAEKYSTEKDLKRLLNMYKYKTEKIDLTNQENFDKFTKKVWDYTEENNLPKFKTCAKCLALEFIKGKEPIDKGFMLKNEIKEK